ncbi:MAG: hydroxysqualene dehydroxylase HpnE [Ignavibacteria bacterium]
MGKIAVIGGGLAGLSSAVLLSEAGYQVELFEAAPKLGGRAYSFHDSLTNDIIDNGQHIMMGCYTETLRFLKLTQSLNRISVNKNLKINFLSREKGLLKLEAKSGFYPVNLLLGLLGFKMLDWKERLEILKVFSRLFFIKPGLSSNLTVFQWLKKERQSDKTIKSFWEILVAGALNTEINIASAEIFISMLKTIFLTGNKAAAIIIPKTGLSELFCENALDFIIKHGGKVHLSMPVSSLETQDNRIMKIVLKNSTRDDFDFIISAVPFYALNKILQRESCFASINDTLRTSPILSAHLWLKENNFAEEFYGLIDSPVHWVFNHDSYITIVISSADKLIQKSKEEILRLMLAELEAFFSFFRKENVYHSIVIKEKRATFVPDIDSPGRRAGINLNITNLVVSGDWTNTGLPATIESAILSGRLAFNEIVRIFGTETERV